MADETTSAAKARAAKARTGKRGMLEKNNMSMIEGRAKKAGMGKGTNKDVAPLTGKGLMKRGKK